MAGTFEIVENRSDAVKFRGMVSFNGKKAEYYEVDLDVVDRAIEDLQKEKAVILAKEDNATEKDKNRATEIDQEIATKQESMVSATAYVLAKLQSVADQDALPKDAPVESELQAIG